MNAKRKKSGEMFGWENVRQETLHRESVSQGSARSQNGP